MRAGERIYEEATQKMREPIFVHHLTQQEWDGLQAGLRSESPAVLRRCKIVLLSVRGQPVSFIAKQCGCTGQTVRNVIHAFDRFGLRSLRVRSSRPHTIHVAFSGEQQEALLAILAHPPIEFGKQGRDGYAWTYLKLAEVCFERGVTPVRVSAETVRATLRRMHIDWWEARFVYSDRAATEQGLFDFLFEERVSQQLRSSWR